MNKTKEAAPKVAASIILQDPSNYSASGMRDIAAWARRVVRDVSRYRTAGKLGTKFVARYYYGDDTK